MAIRDGKARPRRIVRQGAAIAAAGVLCVGLAACGGRTGNPVAAQSQLDGRLSCAHLGAERKANLRQMEDLRDERVDNRVRSVSRLPGALISGNPLSLIALADPSTAIYDELAALERRNERIDALLAEKRCGAAPSDPRIAAVTPLDESADLYAAQYELSEAAQEALEQEQPEIAPEQIDEEEASEILAQVQSAELRDEETAEIIAEEAEAEESIGEAYEAAGEAAAPAE